MSQIKSQKKRNITNEKARQANASQKSTLRTACKKAAKAVEDKNLTEAKELLKAAVALIDHLESITVRESKLPLLLTGRICCG